MVLFWFRCRVLTPSSGRRSNSASLKGVLPLVNQPVKTRPPGDITGGRVWWDLGRVDQPVLSTL